jgi:hypothetical protein
MAYTDLGDALSTYCENDPASKEGFHCHAPSDCQMPFAIILIASTR